MASLILSFLCIVFISISLHQAAVSGAEHAPDSAPVINRETGWCEHGTITRTTGECICSSHLGFYCRSSSDSTATPSGSSSKVCQSGYGISFFHNTCTDCSCVHEKIPAGEWKERKNALKQSIRKQASTFAK